MCSTSDDRTVRLWGIYDEKKITNCNNVEWNKVQVKLSATMYGHTARVWRAVIKENTVVSIGEVSQISFSKFSLNLHFIQNLF